MASLSLPLAVALAFEAASPVALSGDRADPPQPESGVPAAMPAQSAPDNSDWQGYPNKALRETIRCPKKTWKRVRADTYRELFADQWHDQPEPSSASDLQKVRIEHDVAATFPVRKFRSVPEFGYAEVFALIGTDGGVLESFVVCSTDPDFHDVSLTAVRRSSYLPAKVAGSPILSIVRRPYFFQMQAQ
jgi:hypothetical protein